MALLSACGGGGGGAVSLEPQDDSAALMSQLGEARTEIVASIPADRQAEFERKIAALEQDLNAARASVAELSAQLMAILEDMRNIAIPPETPEPSPPNNTPTAADCHANEQILVGDNCQSCGANMQFSVDKCIPTAVECYAKSQILVGDNCQSCEAGEQFDTATNTCKILSPPTAAECHTEEKVLVGDSCQNCAANMLFRDDQCVAKSTLEAMCNTNGMTFQYSSSGNLVCHSCGYRHPAVVENRCVATVEACNANDHVLSTLDGRVRPYCNECYSGTQRKGNVCVPTADTCHARRKVLVGDNCESCDASERYDSSSRECIPIDGEYCHRSASVLVDGRCQKCDSTEIYSSLECLPINSDNCHKLRQAFVDGSCQRCDASERYDRDSRECLPIDSDYCHDRHKIFVDGSCQSCNYLSERYDRDSRECRPLIAYDCHISNQILVGNRCNSCPKNMRFSINQCVELSEFATAEYQKNPMYDAINPLYAYERGYFGQGVTVAIFEYESGYAIGHPDLAANYITTVINGLSSSRLTSRLDNSHSSRVAGLLGAVRDGVGMHGIAPEVKMIPFGSSPNGFVNGVNIRNHRELVVQYLRDNNIPIINNSWGSQSTKPISIQLTSSSTIRQAALYSGYTGNSDIIWVWSNGNNGYGTSVDIRTSRELLYPIFHPHLENNWLGVISVDRNNQIRSYSNACGPAKDWCVATGVYDSYTPTYTPIYGSNDNGEYRYEYRYRRSSVGGNSFAAPQVSGALALLYGAIGIQSPQIARAILLTTTTDLGDPGIDEIYGRGLINISAAIVMIENMKTATADGLSAVSFADLRGELPSGFAHLHNELSAVQVAIKLTNGLHYNVALSEMLTPGDDSDVPLGDGATDMLADAESDSRRGFFAYGDMDAELGLRYYGGTGGFSYIAEGQHAKTNQRFFAGDFGALGGVSGKVYSGKVGFVRDMNMAGMQIFGDYERAAVGGDGDEGNLIVGVRDAQAESWMAGLSFGDIWKYGDKIKLSARQEMGLSGGDLIVRYPHAVGDFHETFIGEGTQEIEVREAFLPLKQKALMLYTAGYAQKFTAKSEWAAALEYNAGNNAKALSLIWQGEF